MGFENYVILGNDALLKCDVPSFVGDLVDVFGWLDNEGTEYLANSLHYGDYMHICSSTNHTKGHTSLHLEFLVKIRFWGFQMMFI